MKYRHISLIEVPVFLLIAAFFIKANLTETHIESEYKLFTSTYFDQYFERGWPVAFQKEICMGSLSSRDEIPEARERFHAETQLRVTSFFGAFSNASFVLIVLFLSHVIFISVVNKQRKETKKGVRNQ